MDGTDILESFHIINKGKNTNEMSVKDNHNMFEQDMYSRCDKTKKYIKKGTDTYSTVCTTVGLGKYIVSFIL